MIQQRMCVPVFYYAYRPLLNKQFPEDSGFSLTLFENGVLVYNRYVNQNVCAEQQNFVLNPCVYHEYLNILEPSMNWLGMAPRYLRGDEQSVFSSCFAYDGVDPIVVWDPARLIRKPFCSADGIWTRRLCLLFEEVALLLMHYGINLSLDNFCWNSALISPVVIPEYGANTPVAN